MQVRGTESSHPMRYHPGAKTGEVAMTRIGAWFGYFTIYVFFNFLNSSRLSINKTRFRFNILIHST